MPSQIIRTEYRRQSPSAVPETDDLLVEFAELEPELVAEAVAAVEAAVEQI